MGLIKVTGVNEYLRTLYMQDFECQPLRAGQWRPASPGPKRAGNLSDMKAVVYFARMSD